MLLKDFSRQPFPRLRVLRKSLLFAKLWHHRTTGHARLYDLSVKTIRRALAVSLSNGLGYRFLAGSYSFRPRAKADAR